MYLFRIAEGVEKDQKMAVKMEQEREMRRKMREEEKEMEKRSKEAEDIMLGRKTKGFLIQYLQRFANLPPYFPRKKILFLRSEWVQWVSF